MVLPVVLSTAAPAVPTLSRRRLPATKGELAKPHVGTAAPISAARFFFQITRPETASKQHKSAFLLQVKTRPPSTVGVALGPPS